MGCFRGRRSANTSTRWRCGIVCVAAPISETRSGSRPATVAMVGRKRTSSLGWAKALERQLVEWEYAVPLDVPFNRTAGFHRTCAWFLGEAAEQRSMMAANCLVHALVVRMTFERKAAGATLERTLGELDGLPETVISAAYHSSSPLREEMLRACMHGPVGGARAVAYLRGAANRRTLARRKHGASPSCRAETQPDHKKRKRP